MFAATAGTIAAFAPRDVDISVRRLSSISILFNSRLQPDRRYDNIPERSRSRGDAGKRPAKNWILRSGRFGCLPTSAAVAQMFRYRDGERSAPNRLIRHGRSSPRRIKRLRRAAFRHCLSPSALTAHTSPAFAGHDLLAHFMIITLSSLRGLRVRLLHLRFARKVSAFSS